ncbi:2-succinyl-6-hydroxy-2,4-cyclohexadiene-1-carboxylate synthase [Psychrobacillus vulpis]|uniref:2-succinyl-6-hydroxy-2, 4-cyclohexadiene-1-carboxylate synthase n=1 Tax=Psychrobacillus vulpis TaxID=2325572 RepID=UPI001F0FE8B1|nr:2-succinyl-6-hydroxy-2,4-cyclohexadiene-1-carboxylate synthase [Psychrobacillus vulpis]
MESINVNIRSIEMHIKRYNIGAKEKVVLLHGFTSSSSTWKDVINFLPSDVEVLTVDLIGHGQTSKPSKHERYYVEEQIEDLHALFQQIQWTHFTLVGYSMGGRLALAYAAKYPVDKLILESSSPGLANVSERLQRKQADSLLAERIINEGIKSFVNYWENIPLFHSQKSIPYEKQLAIREERLTQSEIGLSNSLKGFSTGVQTSYWDKLEQITFPTLLLTGELDQKFCEIAKQMASYLPNAKWKVVTGVGHAIHVENPELFATIVEEIILKED